MIFQCVYTYMKNAYFHDFWKKNATGCKMTHHFFFAWKTLIRIIYNIWQQKVDQHVV